MLLIALRYLLVGSVLLGTAPAQSRSLNIYVADFRSDDNVDPKILARTTDDFEFLLSELGSYNLLERRRLGDLKSALQNEANLHDDPQLVKTLRSRGVDAVLFGRVQDDVDAYAIYASLVRLDSSIIWKRTSSLSRSLLLNRDYRLTALRKLVSTVIANDTPNNSAGVQASTQLVRRTPSASFAGRIRITNGNPDTTLIISHCERQPNILRCVQTVSMDSGEATEIIATNWWSLNQVWDSTGELHKLVDAFFLSTTGKALPRVNLGKGESAVFIQDFEVVPDNVKTVKITANGNYNGQLSTREVRNVLVH